MTSLTFTTEYSLVPLSHAFFVFCLKTSGYFSLPLLLTNMPQTSGGIEVYPHQFTSVKHRCTKSQLTPRSLQLEWGLISSDPGLAYYGQTVVTTNHVSTLQTYIMVCFGLLVLKLLTLKNKTKQQQQQQKQPGLRITNKVT